METENIKLYNSDGISEIIERLGGIEEDTQTGFDLLFVALVYLEGVGIEVESVYEVIPQQYKIAKKMWGTTEDD